MKKILKVIALLFFIMIGTILLCNYIINTSAKGKTFYNVTKIPKNRVGIVLGTSHRLSNGASNPYYTYRINAVLKLFKAGKIDFVLVSGDNGSKHYNEPKTFKKDLIKSGIPSDKIFLDYAGFRTLDSMVRAKNVFGLDSATIISQKFHNERAIYLAEKKGLQAIGFNAMDVPAQQGLKVRTREYFARVKVFLDVVLNTQPKFYGDKIEIK